MNTELYTFQDAVEHLLDMFDEPRSGRSLRMARRAVLEAYREIPQLNPWTYYESTYVFKTEASQTTGSIAYDHTGGTYEREVTLSDATWPANARFYKLKIGNVTYPIADRKSSTIITLREDQNPGADISAGQTYTIWRETYPWPIDFRALNRMFDLENEHEIPVVDSQVQYTTGIFIYDSPDTPWQCSIRNDGEYYNSLSLVLSPPPSSAKSYGFLYDRMPRQLIHEKKTGGTVTISSGSTTVTGNSTAFTSDMVGSVIRFSSSALEPTSIVGNVDDTDNPFICERTIQSVASSTSLTVDSAYSNSESLTNVGYVISDPLDMQLDGMLTAFQKWAEYAYTRVTKRYMDQRQQRRLEAREALTLAREHDVRAPYNKGTVPYDRFRRVQITTDAG